MGFHCTPVAFWSPVTVVVFISISLAPCCASSCCSRCSRCCFLVAAVSAKERFLVATPMATCWPLSANITFEWKWEGDWEWNWEWVSKQVCVCVCVLVFLFSSFSCSKIVKYQSEPQRGTLFSLFLLKIKLNLFTYPSGGRSNTSTSHLRTRDVELKLERGVWKV